ncbi:MAG: biopolymer transporter ExbD [Verrucomicrobia bacterium]|nr:biopolymer transporter ExbD [Verrucomicrobiota bacterium]
MRAFPILAVCLIFALSARAELVFQGYMTTPARTLFVISVDQERTSGWLTQGQEFAGVSVVAFDAKTELLTVEVDGKRQALHLAHGQVRASSEATGKAALKPILISIGGQETISVGDDKAMLAALKTRFTEIAAMTPQPAITLRAPGDAAFDRLSVVFDLCKATGIKRFSISSP